MPSHRSRAPPPPQMMRLALCVGWAAAQPDTRATVGYSVMKLTATREKSDAGSLSLGWLQPGTQIEVIQRDSIRESDDQNSAAKGARLHVHFKAIPGLHGGGWLTLDARTRNVVPSDAQEAAELHQRQLAARVGGGNDEPVSDRLLTEKETTLLDPQHWRRLENASAVAEWAEDSLGMSAEAVRSALVHGLFERWGMDPPEAVCQPPLGKPNPFAPNCLEGNGFSTEWILQRGTNQQYTRCAGGVRDQGQTCVMPEIRYGNAEGSTIGVPCGHWDNSYTEWCKQLGFAAWGGVVKYGERSCEAPWGGVFMCNGFGESALHWCDPMSGGWRGRSRQLTIHECGSPTWTGGGEVSCHDEGPPPPGLSPERMNTWMKSNFDCNGLGPMDRMPITSLTCVMGASKDGLVHRPSADEGGGEPAGVKAKRRRKKMAKPEGQNEVHWQKSNMVGRLEEAEREGQEDDEEEDVEEEVAEGQEQPQQEQPQQEQPEQQPEAAQPRRRKARAPPPDL